FSLVPPTRSTLFPYTTLFRSLRAGRCAEGQAGGHRGRVGDPSGTGGLTLFGFPNQETRSTDYAVRIPAIMGLIATRSTDQQVDRSEEHTSELQSRENLVCRLL